MDCSPPCSSVHGILQARILEWVAPGDLPNPGVKPESLMSLALAGRFFINSATWEACFFLEALGKISSCLFQVLEASHILWLVVLSPPSKITASHLQIFHSDPGLCCHFFSEWPLLSFFPNKDHLAITLAPTYLIQAYFSISRFLITTAKPLLPCKVIYSQVLGIRTWAFWGVHYSALWGSTESEGRTVSWFVQCTNSEETRALTPERILRMCLSQFLSRATNMTVVSVL